MPSLYIAKHGKPSFSATASLFRTNFNLPSIKLFFFWHKIYIICMYTIQLKRILLTCRHHSHRSKPTFTSLTTNLIQNQHLPS